MARLTSGQRKNVPKSQMGLPGKATKKGGAVSGSYPMPDRAHAIAAKRLSYHASPAERKKINAKADRILGKKPNSKGKAPKKK